MIPTIRNHRLTPNQKRLLLDLPALGKEWADYTMFTGTHRTLRSLDGLGLADLRRDRNGNLLACRTVAGQRVAESVR